MIDLEPDNSTTGFVGKLVQAILAVQVLIGHVGIYLIPEPDHVKL